MAKLLLWRILEPFIQALFLGSIQEARQKTVELSVEFPRRPNRGISDGISTESSKVTKPWNSQ